MKKNRGSIAEMGREVIKRVVGKISQSVYAEEVTDSGENNAEEVTESPKTPTINYEDLIAKARKEEKEKQYKAIEKLKTQVNSFTEQHNKDLLAIAELEKKISEVETKATNTVDDEKFNSLKNEYEALKSEKKTLEEKLTNLQSTIVSREEVEAEVKAELEAMYEVRAYKAEQLAEHRDDILVPELVFGNTKEEIDESIKSALEKSNEIKKKLGIDGNNSKRTPKSPSNPSVGGVQDNSVSMERLATMDVRSKEYAELRKQLGLR